MNRMWRKVGAVLWLFVTVSSIPLSATAQPQNDGLSQQAKACDDNVAYFRNGIDGVVLWSNIFMVSGALVAAIGAGLAGFLSRDTQRKAAAVIGALGAVITILPKVLPDKEGLQIKMSAAERHRIIGAKIRNQFQFARPDESLVDAQKYASARFTDCNSITPPEAVPDLPRNNVPIPAVPTASVDPARFFSSPRAIPANTARQEKDGGADSGSSKVSDAQARPFEIIPRVLDSGHH